MHIFIYICVCVYEIHSFLGQSVLHQCHADISHHINHAEVARQKNSVMARRGVPLLDGQVGSSFIHFAPNITTSKFNSTKTPGNSMLLQSYISVLPAIKRQQNYIFQREGGKGHKISYYLYKNVVGITRC